MQNHISKAEDWTEFSSKLEMKNLVLIPFCGDAGCEDMIKDKTGGVKSLNRPFEQPSVEGKKCLECGKPAKYWHYFGKSY